MKRFHFIMLALMLDIKRTQLVLFYCCSFRDQPTFSTTFENHLTILALIGYIISFSPTRHPFPYSSQIILIIDAGHFHTENPVVAVLADKIAAEFPEIAVEISKTHTDCMKYY